MRVFLKVTVIVLIIAAAIVAVFLFYQDTKLGLPDPNVPATPELPMSYYCGNPDLDVPVFNLPENVAEDIFIPRYYHCCAEVTNERVLESRTTWGDEGETGIDVYNLQGKLLDHYDAGSFPFTDPVKPEIKTNTCQLVHPDYYFQFVDDPETEQFLKDRGYYQ